MLERKIKVAIVSLTSCEGCEISILDLGNDLVELLKNVELINFKYMMDAEVEKLEGADIAFIEGSPLSEKDIALLKKVREKAKIIFALGTCAHLGCVQKIKNYRDKTELVKYVYKNFQSIENNNAGGIDKYINIDGVVPGCPINKSEFKNFLLNILAGKKIHIEETPVCYECQTRDYECVLQKGQICLGPMIIGGCEAICLKSKQGCWGCRGFLPEVDNKNGTEKILNNKMNNLINKLKDIAAEENIKEIEETFGNL